MSDDVELVIPPHSLWLTSVEEDNHNLDMTARNHAPEGDLDVTFEVDAPDGVLCREYMRDNEFVEDFTKTKTIPPERVARITISFRYIGDEYDEGDLITARIHAEGETEERTMHTKLFEN